MWWTSSGPSAIRRVRWLVYICGQRRLLRDAGGAVHLDRLVDDLADPLGHHGLDHGTQTRASWLPSTSIARAAFSTIRRMASISMRALGDHLDVAAQLDDRLAERLAGEAAR